jgi:hypothetical protein
MPRGTKEHESDQEVDALFRLPLAEFTAARNALASKLKKRGDTAEADQVKTIAKPPISAWVANQLFWRQREAFDRLLAAGDAFRVAQAAQMAGESADLRGPLEARRNAMVELSKLATALLRESGHAAPPDTMRRVTTTLEALATYGAHPGAPPAGRLDGDIDPPGFEALAALVPQTGGAGRSMSAPPRVLPFSQRKPVSKRKPSAEDEREREAERRRNQIEARKALQAAERDLNAANRVAEKARTSMKAAANTAK